MADKPLRSIRFPTLDDRYTFAQVDANLATAGAAADAKKTGDEISDLKKNFMLTSEEVPDTVQEYTFTDGAVSQVAHMRSGTAVRTDTFSYGTNTITEVRTLSSGELLTIVTDLTTLETTITYTAA